MGWAIGRDETFFSFFFFLLRANCFLIILSHGLLFVYFYFFLFILHDNEKLDHFKNLTRDTIKNLIFLELSNSFQSHFYIKRTGNFILACFFPSSLLKGMDNCTNALHRFLDTTMQSASILSVQFLMSSVQHSLQSPAIGISLQDVGAE